MGVVQEPVEHGRHSRRVAQQRNARPTAIHRKNDALTCATSRAE
jgi:hypothetical protein